MKELRKEGESIKAAKKLGTKEALEDIKDLQNRVLVICESEEPFALTAKKDPKTLVDFFDKLLFCPKADYSSNLMLVEHALQQAGVPSPDKALVASLSHICKNYTAGKMIEAVKMTLTTRRIQRVSHHIPTCAQEV